MNKISQFWEWFKVNNHAYLFLSSVDGDVKVHLLDQMVENLHKYCEKLYFEIGGNPEDDQEFIVTAEGNSEYFEKVEQLIEGAPPIEGWIYIAFKPRIPGHFKSQWEDLELNTEDMWFAPLSFKDSDDFGVRVYLKNHDMIKDNETFVPLIYKMIETIIGEKSFALDIQHVDTATQPDQPENHNLYPILELPEFIDWRKSKKISKRS